MRMFFFFLLRLTKVLKNISIFNNISQNVKLVSITVGLKKPNFFLY